MRFLNRHAAAFMIIALGISFGLYVAFKLDIFRVLVIAVPYITLFIVIFGPVKEIVEDRRTK